MKSKNQPGKFRRWAARLSAGTFAFGIIVPIATLRPVDRSEWSKSDPLKEAVEMVSSIPNELAKASASNLEAGWAATALTVEVGDPLAGYAARKGAPSTGPGEELWARALYLRAGDSEVCFITADILLVHAGVASDVVARCAEAGINSDSIYFMATHTHCGPGAWGPNVIEESVCGPFDPSSVTRLGADLARAIVKAKEAAEPAAWTWLEAEAPEFLRNRTVENGIVDPALEAIAVRLADGGSIGLLAFFGAHATCVGSEQMTSHADYPGVFVREMEKRGVDFAGFGAASVGSQSPLGEGENEARAETIGVGLAGKLLSQLPTAEWKQKMVLGSSRKEVPLPEFQIRLSDNLRVAEWIANQIHPTTAPIHFVRIDHHRLVGLPVEFSALLSAPLRKRATIDKLALTPTAFNGDYIGYVLPPEIYDSGAYEAQMNFLGPGGGAFFSELIRVGTGMQNRAGGK